MFVYLFIITLFGGYSNFSGIKHTTTKDLVFIADFIALDKFIRKPQN